MKHNNLILLLSIFGLMMFVSSCQQAKNDVTGSEFMPDMKHSIAYEANHYLYYSLNTWGDEEEYYQYNFPRLPVEGTVPRGAAGMANPKMAKSITGQLTAASISIPASGNVPYHYPNTDAGRLQAAQEMIQNPFPISDDKMAQAKPLYDVYCGVCHGEKGDGAGYLVRDDGGKYPAQPANLLLDNFIDMTNGQYYHTIMFGKNLMGGYADKLSHEERWQVIHYIRGLQAKSKKLEYNSTTNTLNSWATPLASIAVEKVEEVIEEKTNDAHHGGGH